MSDTQILSFAEIFTVLGGNSNVARLLGVGASTTSEMKRRGRIPAEYWCDLVVAAQRRGHPEISFELLARLHARGPTSKGPTGFSEESETMDFQSTGTERSTPPPPSMGQFSRWKHLRRSHFASREEINSHISALRDEWDRR